MKAATPPLSSMSSVPLFVYGTLMSPVVMETLIQRRVVGRPVRLLPSSSAPSTKVAVTGSVEERRYDYSRHPVRTEVYPGLVHWNANNEDKSIINNKARNHVCGFLYSNLSSTEMEKLDAFEGDQYTKELCYVQLQQPIKNTSINNNFNEMVNGNDDDDIIQAMVYVWSYPLSALDLSKDWSYQTFEEEHLATYV